MPSRWIVPLSAVDIDTADLGHLHAAVSRWFDASNDEHVARVKPYALSPLRRYRGAAALEVGVATDDTERRLHEHARAGRRLRLGRQAGQVASAPVLMRRASWAELAASVEQHAWVLRFATPATFRHGRRSSPWPAPAPLLRGLNQHWALGGNGERTLTHQQVDALWVSDIDGASEVIRIGGTLFSGFAGRIRYQCDDPAVAALVGPLFALAPYVGVGSATTKGLGTTLLEPTWQPRALESTGTSP